MMSIERSCAEGNESMTTIGRLHVIVDTVELADAAITGGAQVVQVRLKSGTDRQRFDLTESIVGRCAASRTMCLVNDRLDMALATGADGVHLGASDLPVAAARRVAPDGFVIGVSALGTTVPEVTAMIADSAAYADYIGIGPVYATSSKEDIPEPMGEAVLAEVARQDGLPLIAISGITADRVRAIRAMGVHGIAVIGAVSQAPDPVKAVAELRELLERPADEESSR
jgi:thiamine-phosphate pyrophosphorylase